MTNLLDQFAVKNNTSQRSAQNIPVKVEGYLLTGDFGRGADDRIRGTRLDTGEPVEVVLRSLKNKPHLEAKRPTIRSFSEPRRHQLDNGIAPSGIIMLEKAYPDAKKLPYEAGLTVLNAEWLRGYVPHQTEGYVLTGKARIAPARVPAKLSEDPNVVPESFLSIEIMQEHRAISVTDEVQLQKELLQLLDPSIKDGRYMTPLACANPIAYLRISKDSESQLLSFKTSFVEDAGGFRSPAPIETTSADLLGAGGRLQAMLPVAARALAAGYTIEVIPGEKPWIGPAAREKSLSNNSPISTTELHFVDENGAEGFSAGFTEMHIAFRYSSDQSSMLATAAMPCESYPSISLSSFQQDSIKINSASRPYYLVDGQLQQDPNQSRQQAPAQRAPQQAPASRQPVRGQQP
ncbi:hypothetical protein, partial [Marinobacterium jannaschii]|uniref:hypothetical protein n=1 Tax=Marinobacterium jannaschii TaxID=64970 RepID=UPI000485BBBA